MKKLLLIGMTSLLLLGTTGCIGEDLLKEKDNELKVGKIEITNEASTSEDISKQSEGVSFQLVRVEEGAFAEVITSEDKNKLSSFQTMFEGMSWKKGKIDRIENPKFILNLTMASGRVEIYNIIENEDKSIKVIAGEGMVSILKGVDAENVLKAFK